MRRDIVKITAPTVPAKAVNYIFPILVSALLGISFSFMLTSTYTEEIDVKVIPLVITILLFSASATFFHLKTEKKKWLSPILIFATIFVLSYMVVRHNFLRSQIDYLHLILRQYTFKGLPPVTIEGVPSHDLTGLLIAYNVIPALVTTWVITRRKSAFWCVLPYLPPFISSVALNYMFPAQVWCEIILAMAMILCLYQNFRKGDRNQNDKKLIKLSIPALVIVLILGACFPQNKYDQQQVAVRNLNMIRKLIGIVPDNAKEALAPHLSRVSDSYMGSIIMESIANQIVEIDPGHEDLNLVGNFNPPEYTVFYVTRNVNPYVTGITGPSSMYIRTASSDTYTGHEWLVSGDEPDPEEIYRYENPIPSQDATFFTRVNAVGIGGYYFAPCYTDGYSVPVSYVNRVLTGNDFNVRSVAEGSVMQTNDYAADQVPLQRPADCWSDEYLEYVRTTNLEVPDETRDQILSSGILPGWYIDLYNGVTTMSDMEKVIAVTDFVRTLHPYDVDTSYPPSDQDFVVWFLTESETGFCVHYASASVVLLRMLGVPARYTTGYLASRVTDNIRCEVTSKDSHAWVEFFDPEYGWILADPTPGNKAADDAYGVAAIMDKYNLSGSVTNPTGTPVQGGTPTPGAGGPGQANPTRTPSGNGTTDPSSTSGGPGTNGASKKSDNAVFKFLKKHRTILLSILSVILLIVIIRSAYTLFWLRRFRQRNVNGRARAYYRYFNWIGKKWGGKPVFKTKFLAQKAVFSEEGITEEELGELKKSIRHSLGKLRKRQPWYKRIGVKLLFEVKV